MAALAVALAALMAHTAFMNGSMDDHALSDVAAICAVVGGSLAVAGVAVFAIRRLMRRPLWIVPAPLAPALVLLPSMPGLSVRAGPAPSALLQVFRF